MISSSGRRADIDGLRAVAVLLVSAFHMFPNTAAHGFIGVDIFFVLSGFLIGGIVFRQLDQGRFSFKDFYAHRARRIFPPLILVLATSLVIGWFSLSAVELRDLGLTTAECSLFVQNLAWLAYKGPGMIPDGGKHLRHLWSLALEEQFYLIFPLAVWLIHRARLNRPLLLGGALAASAAVHLAVYATSGFHAYIFPLARAWELMAGALAAHWVRGRGDSGAASGPADPRMASAASLVGLGLILLSLVLVRGPINYPAWHVALPVLGTLCLLLAGPRGWVNRTLLSTRPAVWLGGISYSLYLWHGVLPRLALPVIGSEPTKVPQLICLLLSIAISAVSTHLVERPLRESGRRSVAVALTLLLAAVGVAGYVCHWADGFPGRAPATAGARAG
ncbi:acyltransferase family protein [Nitrospirillum iridis]|uniref:Peptidoglycan/LPS O-acetylase OafA/YrhL n=1 Tax=Nitrospirillum iridis TaxID=765888 RepID=A0A7X0ECD7_9PROT|nr:acyltransferase [Nitrospirillum iridis]MBB6251533.1 peptidoglycan/LPS O-acetylase OafA/YrhL [Nitrospirillum iridis]